MTKEILISTRSRTEAVDITEKVASLVRDSKVRSGVCHIFVPHTTAAIAINENADPSVRRDILNELDRLISTSGDYEHTEGNSAAHIRASIVGSDRTVFIENGALELGTWQGIFFLEFDGPRRRNVFVKIVE